MLLKKIYPVSPGHGLAYYKMMCGDDSDQNAYKSNHFHIHKLCCYSYAKLHTRLFVILLK